MVGGGALAFLAVIQALRLENFFCKVATLAMRAKS
jgi:hypothetical protein